MTELVAADARRSRIDWREWLRDNGVYVGIVVLVVVNILLSPSFLSERSLRLQVVQVVPVAIVALGMAVVIGTRGIDISVGSVMAIAAATMAVFLGYGPIPAIVGGASSPGCSSGSSTAAWWPSWVSSPSWPRWGCSWRAEASRSSSPTAS